MRPPLNIAVCGCGIGGLALGAMLANAGHRVVAFDQFESVGPVGSGFLLQPTGLAIMEALGLRGAIEAHGRPIDRFYGRDATTQRLVLDLRYDALTGNLRGLAVQRAAVFDLLLAAANQAGVEIRNGNTVASTDLSGAKRQVAFADGSKSETFDLVVDALGQRSVLRPKRETALAYGALWASLDWPIDGAFDEKTGEQRYHRASRMIGVVPAGTSDASPVPKTAFFWSIKGADLADWRAAPLDKWKDDVLALWPETEALLSQINSHDSLTFAQYRHSTLGTPCAPALAHIGDSYHSTSPQLGQGANMALLDAYALAQGVETAPTLEGAFDHYIWARAAHVRLFQGMSWAFTPVYQSDSHILPILRDWIVAPVSRVPPVPRLLAKMVTGLLGNPLGRLGLEPVGAGDQAAADDLRRAI